MSKQPMNMAAIFMAIMSGFNPETGKTTRFQVRSAMELKPCDPSRHNTLRYDQVEKRRKTTRKANRLKFKRYRRAQHVPE